MLKRSAYFITFSCIALSAVSHAQSSLSGFGTDIQQNTDCSDPGNATSTACLPGAGQNQQNSYPNLQQQNGGSTASPTPRTGFNGSDQNAPTYSDNGGTGRNQNNVNAPQMPPSPPEPLTEFQKLVAATTGQILPIFGTDLFRGVPSTFAPVDQIPVTSDYVIGPGDEVRIRVWGQVNFNADLKVDRSGDVYLPQVGRIHVTGYPFSELSQQIRAQIARVYRNFDLTVDLGQLRSIQIFVVGQARRPGAYTVSSLSTLVNALFASGGPSVQGTMRGIQLKREGKVISTFDLYDLLVRGDKSRDARLLPGDVIFIPPVGEQVAITGSVRKPAVYELTPSPGVTGGIDGSTSGTTLQQLLESAGGLSAVAAGSRVSIERIENHQAREAMEVALNQTGLASVLHDGDLIRFLSIVPGFQKTVTLRGNLANPGRFAWRQGMKLSDLLPDRPSLITRNYWWRRAQLGLTGPEFQPLEAQGTLYQPNGPIDLSKLPRRRVQGQFGGNPQAPPAAANDQSSQAPPQQSLYGQQSTMDVPSDAAIGDLRNQARAASPGAQTETSGGSLAEQQNQIITQNVAAAGQKVDVRLSAPEIDWSYAVIERLDPDTLTTSLVSFNLGKLVIEHDATQDLALQPGDVVTIFSQADIRVPLNQQTKFVKLEGEVVAAGVYSVAPGETLRQIVQRAGGFTQNAYLFGSEFTRESTRVLQQQRLDEYVQSQELQTQRSALNLAASAVTAQDAAAATAGNASRQGLLARLHQLKATGRIVLEVKAESTDLASVPDIQLQDDDHFIVPSVPATVNVVGAVYDQNSFLYQPLRRVGDYLHLAGGPSREADRRHVFIIRADGSVLSKESTNGLWGNNFLATKLNPGDSIVVPEKLVGASTLRGFLNWSQVFSQLALGAASINVLNR